MQKIKNNLQLYKSVFVYFYVLMVFLRFYKTKTIDHVLVVSRIPEYRCKKIRKINIYVNKQNKILFGLVENYFEISTRVKKVKKTGKTLFFEWQIKSYATYI